MYETIIYFQVAQEGYSCVYGDCRKGTLSLSQESVAECAAGCPSPECIGFQIQRRHPLGQYCVRKGAACKLKTLLDSIQTARTDNYFCYKGNI